MTKETPGTSVNGFILIKIFLTAQSLNCLWFIPYVKCGTAFKNYSCGCGGWGFFLLVFFGVVLVFLNPMIKR